MVLGHDLGQEAEQLVAGRVTVGGRLGASSSSSIPGPASSASSASSSASLEPTAMRPSSSASARPGMTLTLLPAWTTVGLTVLRSTA
jgi:hypothetical protein